MSSEDISYYRERATAERDLARSSANPQVAAIHQQMAELYEKLIAFENGNVVSLSKSEAA